MKVCEKNVALPGHHHGYIAVEMLEICSCILLSLTQTHVIVQLLYCWNRCNSVLIMSVVFIISAFHRITAPCHWAPPSSDSVQLHLWNQMHSLTSIFLTCPKVWTRCHHSILKAWTHYQHSSVKVWSRHVVGLLWAVSVVRVNVTSTALGTEVLNFQQVAGTTSTSLSPV